MHKSQQCNLQAPVTRLGTERLTLRRAEIVDRVGRWIHIESLRNSPGHAIRVDFPPYCELNAHKSWNRAARRLLSDASRAN